MALPEPFSDIEHLQLVIRRYLNKQIREDFRDLFGDSDVWEPEIGTTRGSMLRALLHEDSDPIHVTTSRMMLYYFTYGKAAAMQPAIVGVAKDSFDLQYDVAYRPMVSLFFKQDTDAVPDGFHPVEAEISFRLMNETNESLTLANLETLAKQIKTELAANDGYTFDKGKYLCKYYDKENGYDLQLYTISEAEGEQLARKIVGIRNHTFNENLFKFTAPRKNSDNTPGNIRILGKTYKKQRWRPTARVRFLHANLLLHNLAEPRCLVDRTGKKRSVVEKTY